MSWKRTLSMMLAICLIVGMIPANVFAAETTDAPLIKETTTVTEKAASSVADYPVLELGVRQTAEITTGGAYDYYTFTPTTSCQYQFASHSEDYLDSYGHLYDADMNELAHDDDGNGNGCFSITLDLSAGVTYILGARLYNNGSTGSFEVSVEHMGHMTCQKYDVAPTCTTDGQGTFTCESCGYEEVRVIPAGHKYEVTDSKAVTCTEDGWKTYTCSVCGDTYTETITTNGHDYNGTGTPATCTEPGNMTYTCMTCGHSYTDTPEALGHAYINIEYQAPTCHAEGYRVDICWRCEHTKTETLPVQEHYFNNGECNYCGDPQVLSGTLTDTLSWSLSGADGILHIEGTGAMPDYTHNGEQPWVDAQGWITGIEISDGITRIGNCNFQSLRSVKTVAIPETVTEIGDTAFAWAKRLRTVTLPAGLTVLGSNAFYQAGLLEITVPGGIKTLEYSVFGNCAELKSVVLEEGITDIGSSVFCYCAKLTDVQLPASLLSIGSEAFRDTGLKAIALPAGLTGIDHCAFQNAELEAVTIPASVTYVNPYAFSDCESLTAITVEAGNTAYTSINGMVFQDGGATLHILPDGLTTAVVPADVRIVNARIGEKLQSLIFEGDIPAEWNEMIGNENLRIFYPAANATWTAEAISNLGLSDYNVQELPGLAVLSGPSDTSVDVGETVTFSVEAIGAVSYVWKELNLETGEWFDVATGNDWTFTAGEEHINGKTYYCEVTGEDGTTWSSNTFYFIARQVYTPSADGENFQIYVPYGAHSTIRFTANYSGLYYLRLVYDTGIYNYIDNESDMLAEEFWVNSCDTIAFIAEEGKEYSFRILNDERNPGSVTIDVQMVKPTVLTEGQVLDVELDQYEWNILQLAPTVSGWYQVVGASSWNLADTKHEDVDFDENYESVWLEAGETYYLQFSGDYGYTKIYPVMIEKMQELMLGESVSGAFSTYNARRVFWFIPEETGMYRLTSDNQNVWTYYYDNNGYYNFNDKYIQMEKGTRYRLCVQANSDYYETYTVNLERLPEVTEGSTAIVHLDNGAEYNGVFFPTVTDKYILIANAPDGTDLQVWVNGGSGSNDDRDLTAGETVQIKVCNYTGMDLDNIVLQIIRQPEIELDVATPVYVGRNGIGHAQFTASAAGWYCFSSVGATDIDQPVPVSSWTADYINENLYKIYYYLNEGQHVWLRVSGYGHEQQYVDLTVTQVEALQPGEAVGLNLANDEGIAFVLEITEAGRYYWKDLSDNCLYGLYRATESDFVDIQIDRCDFENSSYLAVELEAGKYFLFVESGHDVVSGDFCVNASPEPESIRLTGKYAYTVGDEVFFHPEMTPGYATLENVTWSVGDATIMEIVTSSTNGVKLKMLRAGTTTLTATMPDGTTHTGTFVVKEMVNLSMDGVTTVEIAGNDYETLAFVPETSGYYVLAFVHDREGYYGDMWPGYTASTNVDNTHYIYLNLEGGRTYRYSMLAYSSGTTVTIEVHEAVAPTVINLASTATVYLNTEPSFELSFGSPWEFAPVEWTSSDTDLLWPTHNGQLFTDSTVYDRTGTVTLTATAGGISASCEVTISAGAPLTLNEAVPLELPGNESSRYTFTPDETGFYVFSYGVTVYSELSRGEGEYVDRVSGTGICAAWLETGVEYTLSLYNQDSSTQSMEVKVSKPEALAQGVATSVTVNPSDSYQGGSGKEFRQFTPTESGYYNVKISALPGMSLNIYGAELSDVDKQWTGGDGYEGALLWMEAGETYYIILHNDSYAYQTCDVSVEAAPAPDHFWLQMDNGATVLVDSVTWLHVNFSPAGAAASWSVSIDNTDVLVVNRTQGSSIVLQGKAVGTATVTVTCNGMSESVTYTVTTPTEMTENSEATMTLVENSCYFSFTPAESGIYIIKTNDANSSMGMNSCEDNWTAYDTLWDHEGDNAYYRYELVGGKEYIFRLWANGTMDESTGSKQVSVLIKKAETPTSLGLPATVTGYVGNRIGLEIDYGSPWAFTPVRWSYDENNGAVSHWNSSVCSLYLQAIAEGSVVVTATSTDGTMTATSTVTVLDTPELVLGEALSVEIDRECSFSTTFTPTETGYYVFPIDMNSDIDVVDADGNYINPFSDENQGVFWLQADQTYTCTWYNYTGARTMSLLVKRPDALPMNEAQSIVLTGAQAAVFSITVTADDWYLIDTGAQALNTFVYCDGHNTIASAYGKFALELRAGVEYLLVVRDWDQNDVDTTLTLSKCPEPDEVYISGGKGNDLFVMGTTTYFYANLNPEYARTKYSWTVNEEYMTIVDEGDGYIGVQMKAAGETTITVTTANGKTASMTIEIVKPETLNLNEAVEISLERQEMRYYKFTAPEDGIYVLGGSTMVGYHFSVEGNVIAGMSCDEGDFRYVHMNMGESILVCVRNYSSSKTVNLEIRKAETPTAVVLPEIIIGYEGNHISIPVCYHSPWAYPAGAIGCSVDGTAVKVTNNTEFFVTAYAAETGTATLTVTLTIGETVLTDTCQITVKEPPILEVGKAEEITLPAWGSVMGFFVPETSGYYVVQCEDGGNVYLNIDEFVQFSNNCRLYYLEKNIGYDVNLDNNMDAEATYHVLISQPQTMSTEEGAAVEILPGGFAVLKFSPETSDYYHFYVNSPGADFTIISAAGNNPDTMHNGDGEMTHMSAKLSAEVTYIVAVRIGEYEEAYIGGVFVENMPAPEEITIRGNTFAAVGNEAYLWLKFEPTYCLGDLTVSVSDPTVAELVETGADHLRLKALKPGAVTVTVTCNGCTSAPFTLNVVEPQHVDLVLDQTQTVTFEPNGITYLHFSADGDYVLSFKIDLLQSNILGIQDGPISASSIRDGMVYIFTTGLTADTDYPYMLINRSDESVKLDVTIQKVSELASASLNKTEVTLTRFATVTLSIVAEPATALAELQKWSISDDSVLAINWGGETEANFVALKPGTVTVTAVLTNGLELTATVTVVDPEVEGALTLDQYAGTLKQGDEMVFYSFTAPESGAYFFATVSDWDTYITVYDSAWNELDHNDDYDKTDPGLWLTLDEGETVYIGSRLLGYGENMTYYGKTVVSTHEDVYDEFPGPDIAPGEQLSMMNVPAIHLRLTVPKAGEYVFRMESKGTYCVSWINADGSKEKYSIDPNGSVTVHLEAGVTELTLEAVAGAMGKITFVVEEAAAPIVIGQQPVDTVVYDGEYATFTVVATGENLTYQWQIMGLYDWVDLEGETAATLRVYAEEVGAFVYRCLITDGYGAQMGSNAVSLTVNRALRITGQPANQKVIVGERAEFAILAVGTEVTYQWQYRVNADGQWTDLDETGSVLYVEASMDKNGYEYRCVVTDIEGNTKTSDAAKLTCSLPAPEITKFQNTADGIKVTWNKVDGAERYRVYVKSGNAWSVIGTPTGNTFTYTGVESGKEYIFTVRCVDAANKVSTSGYNADGWAHTYIGQPEISLMESLENGIKITWDTVAGAERYRVYVKSGSAWKAIGNTTETSFVYTEAVAGTSYTFTVRCVDAANEVGTSAYSNTGWSHKYYPTPAIAKLESVVDGVKISWNAINGVAKYRVYVKNASGGWTKLTDIAGTSYTWPDAETGVTYTFTIRGMAENGKTYLTTYSDTGWSHKFYPKPEITKLENTAEGVKVTWGAINGAARYRIYVKTGTGSWKNVGNTTETSFVYTGAESGTVYYFTVRCVTDDNASFTSNYNTTGWKKTYVAQPAISALESGVGGIKLSWDAVAGAGQYRVYVKSGSDWKMLADVTGTSYTWTGAKTNTTYTFTIRARNAAGTAFVSSYNATGWSHKYYPKPEITNMTSGESGVKLTWTAINGAERYRIYVKSGSAWKVVGNTTMTSFTWTGAEAGKTYTFTVRCVNDANTASTSNYSTTGWKHKYYPTPRIKELRSTEEGIKLTWLAVNGAANYRVYVKTETGWKKLTDTTDTSYTWTGAEVGQTYVFTLRCIASDGKTYVSSYNTTGWSHTHE